MEPPDASEYAGLKHSAHVRLSDARNRTLSLESRFDLAYAAHALCLAALRRLGYRSDKRYIVFQVLTHLPRAPRFGVCSTSATG